MKFNNGAVWQSAAMFDDPDHQRFPLFIIFRIQPICRISDKWLLSALLRPMVSLDLAFLAVNFADMGWRSAKPFRRLMEGSERIFAAALPQFAKANSWRGGVLLRLRFGHSSFSVFER
jgi:hypothetical protein